MSREKKKCPWCDYGLEDLWEYGLENDGDQAEVQCPNCDKRLMISLSVSYDYTIEATGCEMHRLKLSDHWWEGAFDFVEFKCADCKENFYDWHLPGGKYPRIKPGHYYFIENALPVVEKRGIKVIPRTES